MLKILEASEYLLPVSNSFTNESIRDDFLREDRKTQCYFQI